MVENAIQIKSGLMRNVDVSVKIILYVKNIIFGTLQPCILRHLRNNWALIHQKVKQHWGGAKKRCCLL